MIRIRNFVFLKVGNSRECSCQIEGGPFSERLFFKCDANALPDHTEPSGNFALVGLLYPAMVLGEDLEIDAPVSPLLLYAIQHDIQSLLIDYLPELKRIKVFATSAASVLHSVPQNVATGFSAGVDTFTTLSLFMANDVPDTRRLTSLTTFDVGAMGRFDKSSEVFERYSRRVRDYAENNGFIWQTARSNLDQFYRTVGGGFQLTHVIRNIAAAFVFEDMYSCYLYSSTYPYRTINTGHDDMSFIEPILLPLLSTETLQFVSAGAGLARYQKMELVSTYLPAMKMLDVCVSSVTRRMKNKRINCSKCWKCSRAMLNLDLLGRLNDFEEVFDIEYYRSNKDRIIQTVFQSARKGKPADRDLIALMRDENFDFKVSNAALPKFRLLTLIPGVKRLLPSAQGLKKFYRTIRGRKF